jgi:hypothetical protein
MSTITAPSPLEYLLAGTALVSAAGVFVSIVVQRNIAARQLRATVGAPKSSRLSS